MSALVSACTPSPVIMPGGVDHPGYMTMGQGGMGDMAYMSMPVPENSITMTGTRVQYSKTTVGGMFTIVKVREQLASYADPGWYRHPPGTLADKVTLAELKRDGIKVRG